jgi:hypothetical protein
MTILFSNSLYEYSVRKTLTDIQYMQLGSEASKFVFPSRLLERQDE